MAEFNAKQQLPGLLDWMRAQMKACGGKTAVIGISGGKDSSVTAALSVAAYGRENVVGVLMPDTSCSANQMPSRSHAGRVKILKKMMKIASTSTFALGNISRYAPITPLIAPDAPTIGTADDGSAATCASAAASPVRR